MFLWEHSGGGNMVEHKLVSLSGGGTCSCGSIRWVS